MLAWSLVGFTGHTVLLQDPEALDADTTQEDEATSRC